jgi:formyltetrahydrofolate-dependent phosphoribosylglycinamide formyltransferase
MSSHDPTGQKQRLVVLVSGNGSNLQAIIDACAQRGLSAGAEGSLPAEVKAVFSDRPQAYGLERARLACIPAITFPKNRDQERRDYDARLAAQVAAYQPDWVVLAGWMRVLTTAFLERFPGRVINLHPALPGMFPGVHAIERAYAAFQAGEISQTGVMVHLVPDEGVDCGPVLAEEGVPIYPQDSLEDLETRIHTVEHRLLVAALKQAIAPADFEKE